MYHQSSNYNTAERWMSIKFGVIVRFFINIVFFFRVAIFGCNWTKDTVNVMSKTSYSKQSVRLTYLEKLRKLKMDTIPYYYEVASYLFQMFNKYKALSLYCTRFKQILFFKKYRITYNKE